MSSEGPKERPSRSIPGPFPAGRPNTVGLHEPQLVRLLDAMDAAAPGRSSAKRDFIRWPFRRASLRLRVEHPDGREIDLRVACRNLSRSGMSVLHSSFVYPGTACVICLPHPTRGEAAVRAKVARCVHRAGVVHEVGLTFESPVDVRDYIRSDLFTECFSLERVVPEDLKGAVLYVDPDPIGTRLFRHALRETSLQIRTATRWGAAIDELRGDESVIVSELYLPDGVAPDLIAALREHGCRAPVIVMTSDTSAEARRLLGSARTDALVAKPFREQTILRAIAEFLVVQARSGRGATPAADPVPPALAESFALAADGYAAQLQGLLDRGDAAGLRMLAFQISGTAPMVGFAAIGELAATAAGALGGGRAGDAAGAVRALIAACRRARHRSAA